MVYHNQEIFNFTTVYNHAMCVDSQQEIWRFN